jgi:uncharacterized protein (TIGR01244 family)
MLSLLLALTLGVAQAPQTGAQAPALRNFLRINDQFCTGGQPTMEGLAQLKAQGVRTIINLRTPGEYAMAEEEAKARELDLRYFNIPVVYRDPKDEQVDEFLKLTDDPANRPAFIHCTAAIRVGAFWMIRRVLRDGFTLEKAEEEARTVGLVNAPHLVEFARTYIEAHKKGGRHLGNGVVYFTDWVPSGGQTPDPRLTPDPPLRATVRR